MVSHTTTPVHGPPPASASPDLDRWEPEDERFWASTAKRVAFRNLFLSIPCLLCGFAVWIYWSVIIVQMQSLGFPFTKDQLYTLPAVAGLAGATLRIPNSFVLALAGGRNVVAATTALLILPALGVGLALSGRSTTYENYIVLAALSGIGGGAFASSMSNISFFFPKRMQGLALGLNAGIGNLGVSLMQVGLPWVMTFGLFGALGGEPWATRSGASIWIQNAGLAWVPILALLTLGAAIGMTNLPMHRAPLLGALGKFGWLLLLGYAASAVGLYGLLGLGVSQWIVLPVTVVLTLALMRWLSPASVRGNLSNQFAIFKNKHTWTMTWLYTMTFGSFIGYSAAFPKVIQDVFVVIGADGKPTLDSPSPLAYAWLGPLVGSLVRPVGGWLSDKWGGARVTQWSTVLMVGCALAAAWFLARAGASDAPQEYFMPFLLVFLLLFITTGVGNGSTFRMIPIIFQREQAGPVLGWTSAIAAYGAFIIPKVFGGQVEAGHAEYALYGFAIYYVTCLAVNWWYYARKGAEVPC